ncbi:hypothetical protein C0995_005233 [Termitomyces sp. Mi166|nr:hypothetical protein C0995_005233 [Termitomyces sp. Mi166\
MLKFIVLSVLLATSAFATPLTTGFQCGSIAHPDGVVAAQERISASFIKVMNTYFQQIRLSFTVKSIRRIGATYNVVHGAADGNAVEQQLKYNHQGDAKTLNIYTVGEKPNLDYAGWSSFPWDYQKNPMNDGIVVDYNTLPGGAYYMVHEVGHWVGLLHTFEGGCNGGDYVDDTPAEASAADGCPVGRDTCPAPGADPIDNMMDYSNDACKTRFTPGQYSRLAQMVYNYRGINLY